MKYLIVIQTECPKTPETEIRRMVKMCFEEETDIKFAKFAQIITDTTPLPLFELLVESENPPFGKLPKYVRRLARA